MAKDLTDKQRAVLTAVEAARAAGIGITAYARANDLNARQLHDSIVALRRQGLLPPTDRPRPRKPRSAFTALRVVSTPSVPATAPPRTGMVCRMIHAGGLVIECGEWPPVSWVRSLTTGHGDAAA